MSRLILANAHSLSGFKRLGYVYSVLNKRASSSLLSRKQPKHVSIQPTTPVVTRFAPSPTGSLHIGSLRTALYNFLLARKTNGKFILRLEDTDRTRFIPGAEKNIYDTLEWCGFTIDEGPIKQSERRDIYGKYIKLLLNKGSAYRCFCSKEKLDSSRLDGYDRHCFHLSKEEVENKMKESNGKFIIRFKSPDKYESFDDLLHGTVNIQDRRDRIGYDDPVLIKSDGMPTYHFANVVDDHLMGITHVIRGEEWLPSTPKHIMLYKGFGWDPPKYAHIPLLTNVESDKKLSKRKNDASVLGLQEKGILPEALINFCVLLGWSPPRDLAQQNHECFTLNELTQLFTLDHLTKGNVKVDYKKLLFFNKHFLQKRIADDVQLNDLGKQVVPGVAKEFGMENNADLTERVKSIIKDCGYSLNTLNEFNETFSYFFIQPDYINQAEETHILFKETDKTTLLAILRTVGDHINSENVQDLINRTANDLDIKKKIIYQILRFALSGSISGSKIHVMVDILGPEETRNRTQRAIMYIESM